MATFDLPAAWPGLPAGFVLRPVQLTDLDAVVALEAQANPAPFPRAGFEHDLTANPLAAYLLLTHQATPLGYVSTWLMVDEAHISFIAVDAAWRRRGIGALLLAATLWQAAGRGAALATLEVRRGNLAAQRLYARFGFATVGVRRGYYKDSGEDALIMTRAPLDPDGLMALWQTAVARLAAQTMSTT